MNVLRWTMPCMLLALLAGCHGKSGPDELVIRDLRLQEDRIYELENYITQYQSMLDSAHRENETLRKALETNESVTAPAADNPTLPRTDGGLPGGALTPPDVDPGTFEDPGGMLVPPTIEPGTPPGNQNLAPPANPDGEALPPGLVPPDLDTRATGASANAVRLVLNKRLTGGLNTDGKPGDDGVLVVIEPRDARDRLVRVPGEVSLLVVDSTRTGPESHVARWDFTAEEADAAWRKTLLGHGMHFSLLWPNRPPKVDMLRLYARVVRPNGQKMLAELDFDVDLAGEPPATHTPGTAGQPSTAPHSQQWVESEVRIPNDPHPLPGQIETRPRREPARVAAQPDAPRADARPAQRPRRRPPVVDPPADPPRTARPAWEPYR